MILDLVKQALLQNLGPLKSAPKGWLRRNCPLCHTQGHGADRRQRFGVQFSNDHIAANCFNCGYHALYKEGEALSRRFKLLLEVINVDPKFIQYLEFESFKLRNNISQVKDGDEDRQSHIASIAQSSMSRWQPMELPEDSYPITQWLEMGLADDDFIMVAEYALSRKIFDLSNFYWSPTKKYNIRKRLIIPYFYNNKIVGYTARLAARADDKRIPKYFQQCPTDFVYNLDNQSNYNRQYVIVTEGVLDAWMVDGVGTLGEITDPKVEIIKRLQKEIIVCPDRDKKGYALVDAAIRNKWWVSFPAWDRDIKDPAAAVERYGRLLTTYSIVQSKIRNADKIRVMWEIMLNERK